MSVDSLPHEKREMLTFIRTQMFVPVADSKTQRPSFTSDEIYHLSRANNSNPGILNPFAIISGQSFDYDDEKEPLGLTLEEKELLP